MMQRVIAVLGLVLLALVAFGGYSVQAQPLADPLPTFPLILLDTPTPEPGSASGPAIDFTYDTCDPLDATYLTSECTDGELVVHRKDAKGVRWLYYEQHFGDAVMEVDARPLTPNTNYGLLFRLDDQGDNFYLLMLTPQGKYGLFRYERPNFSTIYPYTFSNAIKTDGSMNHLQVTAQGSRLSVNINGRALGSFTDSLLTEGRVAFGIESDSADSEVAFDNLRVTPLTAVANGTPVTNLNANKTPTPSDNTSLLVNATFDDCDPSEGDWGSSQCKNGEYLVHLDQGPQFDWTRYKPVLSDGIVQVDVRPNSNPAAFRHGVVFRMDEAGDNFYGFALTRDGRYTLFSYSVDSDFTTIIPPTRSNAIKTGNAANTLKVVFQGSAIALYINGQFVDAADDSTLDSGKAGVYIESDRGGGQESAFDNFKLWELTGEYAVPTAPARPTATRPPNVPTRAAPTATRPPAPTPTRPAPAPTRAPDCPLNAGEAGAAISNNYIGQPMRFTIGGGEWRTHDYDIPGDGKWYLIRMPPGAYTYTASIPGAGVAHGEKYDYKVGTCRFIRFSP